jgi:hypothetical protein
MVLLWWTITAAFASLSLLIIIGNPLSGFIAHRNRKNYSFIPFIGGLAGLIACWTCPWSAARWWCWVPLVADYSIPTFIYMLLFTDAFRRRS